MRYVALLRGINVGGNVMVNMEQLRVVFEALGYEDVKSYINSGNLAFNTTKTAPAKLEAKIEAAVAERFGREIPVMVREQGDIDRIINANPFQGDYGSHKEMHVLFLKEEVPPEKEALLHVGAPDGERYVVQGREIYCHLTAGVAGSLLTKGFFEKKPRVPYTGRNWRTVQKLAEL